MARRQKYEVYVRITKDLEKPIIIWAEDEGEAEDKAIEVVEAWDGVISAEVESVEDADD